MVTDGNRDLWPVESSQTDRVVLVRPELWGAAIIQGDEPMPLISSIWAWLRLDDEGQGLAEYALILALIAILSIVALLFMGGQISKTLSTLGNSL